MVGTRSHFSNIAIKTCTSLPLCFLGMCEGWPLANILGRLTEIQQNIQCTCQSSLCMNYSKGFFFFLSASCTVSIDLAAELSLKLVTAVNCVRSTIIRTSVMQAVQVQTWRGVHLYCLVVVLHYTFIARVQQHLHYPGEESGGGV